MQIREWAEIILHAETLEEKLYVPDEGLDRLRDERRGEPVPWRKPGRPPELEIAPKRVRKRLPHPQALEDPELRVRCLHTFANHELMALELMAWALLAYPDAPDAFRRGLVRILHDEQRHLTLYMDRMAELGTRFGELPVNDHFWRCADSLTTPLKWVCAMNLTFEQANLDHAPVFGEHFRRVGDEASASLMETIARDEIFHVGFGAFWLAHHTAPGASTFETYVQNLTFYNTPDRARGEVFDAEARREAGLDDAFIARMREV